jgi:hypothetical protein
MFCGHHYQRLAIDVVDVADRRKIEIESDERFQIRQIASVQKDVIETNPNDSDLLCVL